jgi:DDE family transposase
MLDGLRKAGWHEAIYCARGDMENRIKECRLDLFADRTSAATMRANQLLSSRVIGEGGKQLFRC